MTEERKMLQEIQKKTIAFFYNVEKYLAGGHKSSKTAVRSERPIKRKVLRKRTGQAWVRHEVKCVLRLGKRMPKTCLNLDSRLKETLSCDAFWTCVKRDCVIVVGCDTS